MKKQVVVSYDVPLSAAPYSQVIKVGNFLFVSGQDPFDANGKLVEQDIRAQTKQTPENIAQARLADEATRVEIDATTH